MPPNPRDQDPPKELVDQIVRLINRLRAAEDFSNDDVRELRLVFRAVGSTPQHQALLKLIMQAVQEAKPQVLARIVDDWDGLAPDEANADRCAPEDPLYSPLTEDEKQSINESLSEHRIATQRRISKQIIEARKHTGDATTDGLQVVTRAFKLKLWQAIESYACCVASLRDGWKSLPEEVRATVRVISGRAVFGLITAKVIEGVSAVSQAVRSGAESTSESEQSADD